MIDDPRLPPRFWDKVSEEANTSCWRWIGGTTGRGYASFSVNRKAMPAHRIVYEALVGPIPEGMQIDHLCDSPSCVNPDHLDVVTGIENVRRHYRQKTHCAKGHALVGKNRIAAANGGWRCRTCRLAKQRAYEQRIRDAA